MTTRRITALPTMQRAVICFITSPSQGLTPVTAQVDGALWVAVLCKRSALDKYKQCYHGRKHYLLPDIWWSDSSIPTPQNELVNPFAEHPNHEASGAVLVAETVPLPRRAPPLILQLFVGVSLKEPLYHPDLSL